MSFLFLLSLGLLFWLIFGKKNKSNSPTQAGKSSVTRSSIASILDKLSAQREYKSEASTYKEIAAALREDRIPLPKGNTTRTTVNANVAVSQVQSSPAEASEKEQKDIQLGELLQNINTMLFGGAFLIVISAAFLVSSNLEYINDAVRVFTVAIFAATFYLTGMGIYENPRLKPAASTFIGVGLVLTPLIGVATQTLLLPDSSRWITFCLTALISAGLSIYTSAKVKQLYIQYIAVASALMALQFGGLSMNIEAVYLVWIMLISGIVMARIARDKVASEYASSLKVSAMISVPLSLVVGLGQAFDQSQWWQFGVSAALAGLFYHIIAQLFETEDDRTTLSTLGLLLWPTATSMFLLESINNETVQVVTAITLVLWSVIYLIIDLAGSQKLRKYAPSRAAVVASVVLSSVAIFMLVNELSWLVLVLVIIALQHYGHYIARRQLGSLLLSLVALLALPLIIVLGWLQIPSEVANSVLAVAYMILGWFLVGAERGLLGGSLAHHGKEMLYVFVGLAFLLVGIFGLMTSELWQALIFTLFTISGGFIKNTYLRPELIPIIVLLAIKAVFSWLDLVDMFNFEQAWLATALLVGSGCYGISAVSDKDHVYYRFSGLVVLALPALGSDVQLSITATYLLSAALALDYLLHKWDWQIAYAAGAVLIFAFNRTLSELGIEETQVFTIPWAIFIASLAYRYTRQGDQQTRDSLTILSLSILTLPLLMQVFSSQSLGYFILILMESALLMTAGVMFRFRLLLWWGLTILIITTFDLVRGVLSSIPNFVATLITGLILISIAVQFLQSKNDGNH